MGEVSQKTIGRLAFYRRVLQRAAAEGRKRIYSHDIAAESEGTSAQVRRDLMTVGTLGHPVHGYDVEELLHKLDRFLDVPRGVKIALAGAGNLGRALLAHFARGRSEMTIEAAFDVDPAKVGRTISGCRIEPLDRAAEVLENLNIDVGVIAVPDIEAQHVADLFVNAGVHSLINMAPVRLKVPDSVFVDDVDIGIAVERAAFFSRLRSSPKSRRP